ncbi:hypothetical protein LTR86_002179 [Recurvomyces mirabilis]|nr:hypothetical protein LTR86_002179 [Recurvomyces mirabilis]
MHLQPLLLAPLACISVLAAPLGKSPMIEPTIISRVIQPPFCTPHDQSTVSSMTPFKDVPHLVQGATYDANPGGSVSFTESFSFGVTAGYTIGGSVGATSSVESAIFQAALSFAPSYSYSQTTTKGTSGTTNCPINNSTDVVTWGLQAIPNMYALSGTVTHWYQGPTGGCTKNGPNAFQANVPATKPGADQGSDGKVEFQCCVAAGGPVARSPNCPAS